MRDGTNIPFMALMFWGVWCLRLGRNDVDSQPN
jgi:hypothetical protein